MAECTPAGPDEPTRDLGRALSIAARLSALPLHLRDAALRTACGDDGRLQCEVAGLLREPADQVQREEPPTGLPRRFGRYELLELIGEGSMGVVYRATQTDTGRVVALKLLRPGAASDAVLQRFRREIVLLARLQHPCIAQILDAGHTLTRGGEEPFLAMELVTGPALLAGAQQLGLDQRARVGLLVQMCRAIAHAHRRGVIHRDLKPDNVRLDGEAEALRPRILDFGVATANAANAAEHTLAKHVVGTLGYIAPEQINGEVDVRCDVYSLGAIAYELLTGRQPVPVRGLGVLTAIAQIRDAEPLPPSRCNPRLGSDLDAVLLKALARRPDDRYASADDLGDDLERWLQSRPVEARRATPLYLLSRLLRRQPAFTLLAAAMCAVIGLASTFTWTGFAAANQANAELTALLTSTVGHLRDQVVGAGRPRRLPEDLRTAIAQMVRRFPEDLHVRRVEADFCQLDGDLARAHGRHRDALELRQHHLELRQLIADRHGDPENLRNLAIARVLVGDLRKEVRNDTDAEDLAAITGDYGAAHSLFVHLQAAAPRERRPRDDLAHSCLRLADLAARRHDDATVAARLREAEVLVTDLARDFPDHPYTHQLLREYLGQVAAVAVRRGERVSPMALTKRMLEHMRRVHELRPDDVHAALFLLSTASSYAALCREHGVADEARAALTECETVANFLVARDPLDVFALDLRVHARQLEARCALDDGDLPCALRCLTNAAQDLLRLQDQGAAAAAEPRLWDIVQVTSLALCSFETQSPAHREAAIVAGRLLLQPLDIALGRATDHREFRITRAQLQALFGDGADTSDARATVATAKREGWFDSRLWLAAAQLLERTGEIPAALENLASPPPDLTQDLRVAGERIRTRLVGR